MAVEERRGASLEVMLVTLGKLEQSTTDIKESMKTLSDRVGIQNGKVGKLQEQYAFVRGCVAILVIMLLPVVVNFVSSWLTYIFHKG